MQQNWKDSLIVVDHENIDIPNKSRKLTCSTTLFLLVYEIEVADEKKALVNQKY